MRPRRLGRLVLVLLLVAGACSESRLTLATDSVGRTELPTGGPASDLDPDEVVDLAIDDLVAFWTGTYPDLYGGRFRPLAGGFVPYGPDTPLPSCGPDSIVYDDIAANALYCLDEDLLAWDRVNLTPDLDERFGPLTVGIVIAHEFAHAIQARGGVRGAAVTLELQADCFAGAWVSDVDDRIDVFGTGGDSLDQAIGGFLELRDQVGISARNPEAHGSGFDRVSAFQDGFDTGPGACVDYEDDPPAVVSIPFTDFRDQSQGGNLPLDQIVEPLVADLEAFFGGLVRDEGATWDPVDDLVPVDPAEDVVTCGDERLAGPDLELASFYCVADDTIYLDGADLVPSLDEIGDYAFAGEVARQYAFAAQSRLRILDRHADTGLHADCLTGLFASAEFRGVIEPDQALTLSPGDLDEIITAFLAFGGGTDASAFERTAAFRTGFLEDFGACESFLD